jgi:peptidoglycan/LPS O-acetylase OafA/YrhL
MEVNHTQLLSKSEDLPNDRQKSVTLRSKLLAAIARKTSGGAYLPEIDGLRSVAILLVIFYHVQGFIDGQGAYPYALTGTENFFRHWISRGCFGVQVFFAISGFIIALPFINYYLSTGKPVSLRQFYIRRVTRLEPPYILNMLFNCVIKRFVDHLTLLAIAGHFLAGLIYSHNLIYAAHNRLNEALWSLEIEFQFYFLAPLFLLAFKLKRPWVRRLCLIAPIVLLIVFRPDAWRIEKSLIGKIEYFFVGILFADIFVSNWRSAMPRKWIYDFLATVGWFGFFYTIYLPDSRGMMIMRPGFLLLAFLGSLGGRFFSAIFRNPWISAFGGMCYTVYLYHSNLIGIFIRLTKSHTVTHSYLLTYLIQFCINFIPIVILSTLLFVFTEKPFMNKSWPLKLINRFRKNKTEIHQKTPIHSA